MNIFRHRFSLHSHCRRKARRENLEVTFKSLLFSTRVKKSGSFWPDKGARCRIKISLYAPAAINRKSPETPRNVQCHEKFKGKISPENRSPNTCRLAMNTAESREGKNFFAKAYPNPQKVGPKQLKCTFMPLCTDGRTIFSVCGVAFTFSASFSFQNTAAPPGPHNSFPSPTRLHTDEAEHHHKGTNTTLRPPTNTFRPGSSESFHVGKFWRENFSLPSGWGCVCENSRQTKTISSIGRKDLEKVFMIQSSSCSRVAFRLCHVENLHYFCKNAEKSYVNIFQLEAEWKPARKRPSEVIFKSMPTGCCIRIWAFLANVGWFISRGCPLGPWCWASWPFSWKASA